MSPEKPTISPFSKPPSVVGVELDHGALVAAVAGDAVLPSVLGMGSSPGRKYPPTPPPINPPVPPSLLTAQALAVLSPPCPSGSNTLSG